MIGSVAPGGRTRPAWRPTERNRHHALDDSGDPAGPLAAGSRGERRWRLHPLAARPGPDRVPGPDLHGPAHRLNRTGSAQTLLPVTMTNAGPSGLGPASRP